jgi:ADP-ribose pyrophosphatase YjhB (NUDIX family)
MTAMPSDLPQRPVLAVLAVVCRAGKVLLVQRSKQPDRGKWGFPGGSVELGETLFEAAARELHEETAVTASPVEVLTAIDVVHRDPDGRVRFHYALIVILCRWQAGDGIAGDDALDVMWASPDAIASGAFATSREVGRVAALALQRCGSSDPAVVPQ